MKKNLLVALIIGLWVNPDVSRGQSFSKEQFSKPPIQYWPRPLWFWNNTEVTEEGVLQQVQFLRDQCGYGGFAIVPLNKNFKPEYLSEDYFRVYGKAIAKAKELGMTMVIYDEHGFPSGTGGAFEEGSDIPRFQLKYPEETVKRLDIAEEEIKGPAIYTKVIPEGKLMGVVAMEITTLKRIDITDQVSNGLVKWNAPSGKWKIMIFSCVKDPLPIVDYLNPEAVGDFTKLIHDQYFSHFKADFGTVITSTFFDEPSMFFCNFRMWTDQFNEKFIKKYSFSPVTLYPALWYNIGPETQQARNYLFGFRAELYALGFPKVVSDWSLAHGVNATGHTAPEEVYIPANSGGDLMKCFKYVQTPGLDKIGGHRPAERFYKIISSVAYNWDKKLVMSESFGAMPNYSDPANLNWNDIYFVAMDQYTKGINMLIPHGVWYDDKNVLYRPELSHRNPLYADSLKVFTQFLARLNMMLQPSGRHIADIAVLYPIQSLLGDHYFDPRKGPANIDGPVDPSNEFYKTAVAQIDYVDVANWLTNAVGKDYTYLHPEVMDEKCSIVNGKLHLQNTTNWEDYKVIIVPSCYMISISNLQKITDFYQQGGTVIFTTRLPKISAELGKDKEIAKLMQTIFPKGKAETGIILTNKKGGKVCFIADPNGQNLRAIIQQTGLGFDVEYPLNPDLQYIHKVVDGKSVYYFANIGSTAINTHVTLQGGIKLEGWDPHTGESQKLITEILIDRMSGLPLTKVTLNLKPYHSSFCVEESAK